jgi:VanZ family protein
MEHSSRFFGPLIAMALPHFTEEQLSSGVFVMRKIAHVAEYVILAILVWRGLEKLAWRSRAWRWSAAGLALASVAVYAISDEVHQAFVPTRQGSSIDVLIDTAGGALGLLLGLGCPKGASLFFASQLTSGKR